MTFSVNVNASDVTAIFFALPPEAKSRYSNAIFMASPTDNTVGTISIDDEFKDTLTAIIATPNLETNYLKGYTANSRYNLQTGGITMQGMAIRTDAASMTMIAGAVSLATINPDIGNIDFKSAAGWISLTAAQMTSIGKAVGTFVQACFSAEKAIGEKIDAGTYNSSSQIDTAIEWPSTTIN